MPLGALAILHGYRKMAAEGENARPIESGLAEISGLL